MTEEEPRSRIVSGTGEGIVSSGTANYMARIVQTWYARGEAEMRAAAIQMIQHVAAQPDWVPPSNEVTPDLLIQATIITLGEKTNEGQLVEAIAFPWFEILRELERNPKFLHEIARHWRKVEELIAGAYKREGWSEVVLTPRSGDRGRDIIATKPGFGSIRIIDQVKAYRPGRKVPANDVRALLGVLDADRNVSKGIITTTSTFAPGVEDEMKPYMPNRLELRTGAQLVEWLKGLMPRPS
jgi:restriction system protein